MLSPEETIEQPAELGDLIVRSLYDVYLNDRILTYVKDSCSQDDATRRFIFHVIPVDNSVIDGKAESNMDFSFKPDDDWQAGDIVRCLARATGLPYRLHQDRSVQYVSIGP